MTRLSLLPPLIAALLLLSAADALSQSPDGGALFGKRRARCHDVAALDPWLAKRADDAPRRAGLDGILARHHARDDAERRAILAYLLKTMPK